jgi:hypothetical protein
MGRMGVMALDQSWWIHPDGRERRSLLHDTLTQRSPSAAEQIREHAQQLCAVDRLSEETSQHSIQQTETLHRLTQIVAGRFCAFVCSW